MTRTNLVLLAAGLLLIVVGYHVFISGGHHPGGGEAIVEVVVPSLDEDAAAGEILFSGSCASCHGTNAAGMEGLAPPLVHIIYEPNHHGDGAFYSAVQNGVRQHHWRFGDMPPVEGVSEAETAKIINYVRILQRANGIN